MHVMVNATNLVKGGALQVAVGFLSNALADKSVSWTLAVSAPVLKELRHAGIALTDVRVGIFARSPAGSPHARALLRRMAVKTPCDAIFTPFGPAYVRFPHPHLMGFANPWVTHPSPMAYATLSTRQQLVARLGRIYRTRWARRADAWVTETAYSRDQLAIRLGVDANRIAVVRNSCGTHYSGNNHGQAGAPDPDKTLRLLVFSAYYPHKNLEIIPAVAHALSLSLSGRPFEFVLTIPADSSAFIQLKAAASRLGVEKHITTVGPVQVKDGPALYRTCHMSFMPTVLETSSAVFPESMAMGLPIVTTDLPFNRDVCLAAASYFPPLNAQAAADAIAELVASESRWKTQISEGMKVLATLPTQQEKCMAYIAAIRKLVAKEPLS